MKGSDLKRFLHVSMIIMLITGGFAALIYSMPSGSSASAYDVSLTVDDASKEVNSGQSVSYAFTITNEGNNGDRYSITKNVTASPSTWQTTLSKTSTANVGSGNTDTFSLSVRAPSSGVNISSYCYVSIKVTSQNDPTNSSSSNLVTTLIKRTYGVSISSPGIKDVDPGDSTSYSFNVKNEGNDLDGFSLEATSYPSGWGAPSIDFDTGKFDPGTTKSATMTVPTPNDALEGSYQVLVKASSITDNSTSATRTVTVNVNQTYKLSITSEGVKQVDITEDRVVNFNVKLSNLGNGEDQFDLEYYIPATYLNKGWGGDLSTTTTSKVDPDGSTNITFYAYTPSKSYNPPVNSKGEFYINATSVGDGTVTRQVKISCVVKPYYDVTLLNTGPSSKAVDPDGTITFDFNVTNAGNDQDTIDMDLVYKEGFEDSSIEPSSVTLDSSESSTITITINPDKDVVKAQSYRFRLYANSTEGPSSHSDFFVSINKQYGAYLDAPGGAIIAKGLPGESYKIPVRVQNKGNGKDTFDLSVEGETQTIETEWSPLVSSATTPQLDSDEFYGFNITVNSPSNATQGTYRFRVNASSQGGSVYKNLWLSVRIPQIYNVDISANKQSVKGKFSNNSGSAETVVFDLDVYNRGSGTDDSISVSVKSAPSAFAGLYSVFFTSNSQSKITIGEGDSENAQLEVETPKIGSGVDAGTYFFIVETVSDNGTITDQTDDKKSEINLSLILEPVHRVKILTGINSSQVNIGSDVNFSVIIQNRGTADDYYQLSLEYPNYGPNVKWSVPDEDLTTDVLEPLEQQTIVLTAKVLNGANPNWGSVWVKVTATHSTDLTVNDTRYFTAVFADDFSGDMATTDNFEQAEPGNKAWYNLSIVNRGTRATDTFEIEVEETSVSDKFDNIEISPSLLTLAPNQRATVSINISIPTIDDKIINTGTYDLVFKATSEGETTQDTDDIIVDNITLKIKVMPVYKVQFLIPEGSTNADPGDRVDNVKLNITNKGNELSTISVKVQNVQGGSGSKSWVSISPSTISDLGPNKATDIEADFRVPTDALAGKVTFTFNATVSGKSISDLAVFEIDVEDAFEVELTVPDGTIEKEADPEDDIKFTVKMKNKGNARDGFDIELSAVKSNWATFGFKNGSTETQETSVDNVAIEGTKIIWLEVSVPDNAEDGRQTFTIEATSKGDDSVSDSQTLTVVVNPRRDVELVTSEDSKEVVPDVDKDKTEVEFEVQVRNIGEGEDNFKVEVVKGTTAHPHLTEDQWENLPKSDPQYSTVEVILSKKVTSKIDKDQSDDITVTLRIPKALYAPGSFDTVIWAYSEGEDGTTDDDKYSQPLVLTTVIEQAYGCDITAQREYVETSVSDEDPSLLKAIFQVSVENTGTGEDDFKLEQQDTLPTDFDITFDTYVRNVDNGDDATTLVTVEMPAETLTGKYTFEVRWISKGDDSVYDEDDYNTNWLELTVEVTQTYGISITTSNEEKDGDVGEPVTFQLTVENQGNDDDTFEVDIREPNTDDWASTSKTKFSLDAYNKDGDETDVTITVRIPSDNEDALAGEYTFNVSIKRADISPNEEDAKEWIVLTVNVKESYDHELEEDRSQENADPGETVSFRFKVINRGNSKDSYDISVDGTKEEWASLSASIIVLEPEDEAWIYLNVTVPLLEQDEFDTSKPYVTDPKDVESKRYNFEVEVESRDNRDAIPKRVDFDVDVEQEFIAKVADISEGETTEDAVKWDVNDNTQDFEIEVIVENQGNKDDTFYLKEPSDPQGWEISVSPNHVLVPIGEQKTITISFRFFQTDGFESGQRSLRFQLIPDDGSVAGKKKKVNFDLFVEAQVPDLVLRDDSIDVPSDPEAGEVNTVTVTVYNTGGATADDVEVILYDGSEPLTTETKNVPANGKANFTFDWTPGTGDHTLKAVVNEASTLIEIDQDNNEIETTKELSKWDISNIIPYTWLLIILVVLFILAVLAVMVMAMNKNREIKELEAIIGQLKESGGEKGGPRKVVKEAAGAPAAPKGPVGLPSAPGSLAPVPKKETEKPAPSGKKENVKVQCPKCKTTQVVSIDKRPSEVPCKECGVTLVIPEKKK